MTLFRVRRRQRVMTDYLNIVVLENDLTCLHCKFLCIAEPSQIPDKTGKSVRTDFITIPVCMRGW